MSQSSSGPGHYTLGRLGKELVSQAPRLLHDLPDLFLGLTFFLESLTSVRPIQVGEAFAFFVFKD